MSVTNKIQVVSFSQTHFLKWSIIPGLALLDNLFTEQITYIDVQTKLS
jgi:hypothetical protein